MSYQNVVTAPLLEQRLEAGLLEMPVAGEGFADAFIFHYDKRNTVGQRPVLITAVAVEEHSVFEKRASGRHDGGARVIPNPVKEIGEHVAVASPGQSISDFQQHPVCRNAMTVLVAI